MRCSRIANFLLQNNDNFKISFYCRENKIISNRESKLVNSLVSNENFKINITANNLNISKNNNTKFDFDKDFFEKYRDKILDYDMVFSDNLTSILETRKNSLLIGSFLWSEVFDSNQKDFIDYKKREFANLVKFKPYMISVKKFTMNMVKSHTKNITVGWPTQFNVDFKLKDKIKNILVIGGGTNIINKILKEAIKIILKNTNFNIYVSSILHKNFKDYNKISLFNFSENDFKNIDLIISRPGMGTITDCVNFNIPILAIYEKNNNEMHFNAKAIEKNNFGLDISLIYLNIDMIIKALERNNQFKNFQISLSKENKNGLREINDFVKKILKNE